MLEQAKHATVELPLVRRLEAVSFRAWPSSSVYYDGSWQLRLTPGHPSLRVNCVVPLDPSDHHRMDERLEKARRRFAEIGRPLVLRQTPLSPQPLFDHVQERGWTMFQTVDMMTLDLSAVELPEAIDHLPSQDIERFLDASLAVTGDDPATAAGLAAILAAIKPQTGLFIRQGGEDEAVAVIVCVLDNDLAGLLGLAVAASSRRGGIGGELVVSALRWARMGGARSAWLQVLSTNRPAIALYDRLGFRKAYDYRYWQQEEPA